MPHYLVDQVDRAGQGARAAVMILGLAAVLAGVYVRVRGLGLWPLGVDEFYISRSVDHILHGGLPAFPCGGYYNRGLLYQYVVALVRWSGVSPELAGRSVSVAASLATLPAAYLLGRRLAGTAAGWLMVIVLSLSIWEIEMARFGRMYAPFQAVFTWYVLAFMRYTVDGASRALAVMVALSIAGTLTWEGGALMGVANILAFLLTLRSSRLRWADVVRLAALMLLLGVLFAATRDLRGYAEMPGPGDTSPENSLRLLELWAAPLKSHRWLPLMLLLPLALSASSLGFIRAKAPGPECARWLSTAGLACALIAAALHLFIITVGILALLLLADFLDITDFGSAPGRRYLAAILTFAALWAALDVLTAGGGVAGASARSLVRIGTDLFGFPDVGGAILRPWGRTMPLLVVVVGAAFLYWCVRVLAGRDAERTPELAAVAAVLCLLIVMGLAVGLIPTERIETRYSFFLYPLCIGLLVAALLDAVRRLPRAALPWVGIVLPLGCFGATEDFQPHHMAEIDSARVNFRVGMTPARAAHYYPRSDVRGTGEWLAAHTRPGDVVLTGIPNVDEYYDRFDYFFLGEGDERYESYVCRDGRTDRWTDHPVLYGERNLAALVRSGRPVYVSVYPEVERALETVGRERGWTVVRVWSSDKDASDVLRLAPRAGEPAVPAPRAGAAARAAAGDAGADSAAADAGAPPGR